MKVILRNPRREVDVDGKRRVKDLLSELGILPSTVLVITVAGSATKWLVNTFALLRNSRV